MARDAMARSKELEEDAQRNRAKMQALERQLLALGHAPCTEIEEQGSAGGASRRRDPVGNDDKDHASMRSMPEVPRLRGGGGATAEAMSAAARASAAAAKAPTESAVGKLARLSVPTLKRRADGTWGEGEDAGASHSAKRLRTTPGATGTGT
jgi:hypothetical protein